VYFEGIFVLISNSFFIAAKLSLSSKFDSSYNHSSLKEAILEEENLDLYEQFLRCYSLSFVIKFNYVIVLINELYGSFYYL
jgi:hypothetical protein